MSSLVQKKCIPCEGGVEPLSSDLVSDLLKQVPAWHLETGKLKRSLIFKNFKAALSFVNNVGKIAEDEGHHPDISIYSWNHVDIILYTHAISGLHQNDFIIASKIDELLKSTPDLKKDGEHSGRFH